MPVVLRVLVDTLVRVEDRVLHVGADRVDLPADGFRHDRELRLELGAGDHVDVDVALDLADLGLELIDALDLPARTPSCERRKGARNRSEASEGPLQEVLVRHLLGPFSLW